jgi:hypothetical protein
LQERTSSTCFVVKKGTSSIGEQRAKPRTGYSYPEHVKPFPAGSILPQREVGLARQST